MIQVMPPSLRSG